MSLNLKDEETVELVSAVAQRLGLTKTGAVRLLARERLEALKSADEDELESKVRNATAWLEKEVWPHTRGLKPLNKSEEEDLLGYNDMLLP